MESIYSFIVELLSAPGYALFLFTGSILGVIFGALPGLTAPMAIAVMLPVTYGMEPKTGLGFLLGVYSGVGYGGAIPAILLNIPGTPAAVMTAVDGNAMAKLGQAGKAIGISTVASFAGGIISILCLIQIAPHLAKFTLSFGPHEYFAAGVVGLSLTSGIIGTSWTKGFWAAGLGLLISFVGLDPLTYTPRFSFGTVDLLSGIPYIPVMIGMFGLTRVFVYINTKTRSSHACAQEIVGILPAGRDLRRITKSILQGSVIGTLIGALPGAGPAIAAFISYDAEKKTSPKLDDNGRAFGEGRIEGIAAPEAANNAVTGGALIPLLTLGIPGSASVAIMLGALLMHNLVPGPLFFTSHSDIIYSIYTSLLIANLFILIACLAGIKHFIKVLSVPLQYLMPVVLVLCIVGAYSYNNNPFHIILMVLFGVLGFLFEKASIPQLPLVLGMILGPIIETNLRYALIIEDGNILALFSRPISCLLLVFAAGIFCIPLLYSIIRKQSHK